jgi:hypothetical protein
MKHRYLVQFFAAYRRSNAIDVSQIGECRQAAGFIEWEEGGASDEWFCFFVLHVAPAAEGSEDSMAGAAERQTAENPPDKCESERSSCFS